MKTYVLTAVLVAALGLGVVAFGRQAPSAPGTATGASASPLTTTVDVTRCDMWSWVDLGAAKRSPKLGKLRQQLLAGVSQISGTIDGLAKQIEEHADSVSVCVSVGTGPKPANVLTLSGRFSSELQASVAASLPGVHEEELAGRKVLANGQQWLAFSPSSVVWANNRKALLNALEGRLEAPQPAIDAALYTSITPDAKFAGMSGLVTALGLGANDWERLTLSSARDSGSSEVRIHSKSEKAAKSLLQVANAQLAEVRASQVPTHRQIASSISVEADGLSVAFRYAGSLDELAAALQALRPSKHHAEDEP